MPSGRRLLTRGGVQRLHLATALPTTQIRESFKHGGGGLGSRLFSVDPHGRLRAVHGVLVGDASMLPRCPQVNPQLSIRAAALATTEAHTGA
ncbi:GMC oxidoreductase [Streptomyces griseoluteus]